MSGGTGAARQITFVGGTSAGFQSILRTAVATIPQEIWSPVVGTGIQIFGARLVSDGGILGYDDREGAYRRGRVGSPGKVVVAEFYQSARGEEPNPDPAATLYHEFGHPVYDHILIPWERLDFDRTARGEAWQVAHIHHQQLIHFLMPSPHQFREIFAESFATAMGRCSPQVARFRQYFARSVQLVEGIIRQRKANP